MKRKWNTEALARLIVLIATAALLFTALLTGAVRNYVHPRLNGLLWGSAFLLLGIAFFTIPELFRPKHNPRTGKYFFLAVPLLAAVLIPAGAVQSRAVSLSTLSPSLTASSRQQGTVIPDRITSSDDIGIDVSSPRSDDKPKEFGETISDEAFSDWYQELNKNMDAYAGKTFRFKGQVFRMSSFAKNEFAPVRYAMVCCVADLQPCGVLCRSDEAKNWKSDDWVWVTGKLKIETYQGQTMPVCYVTKIEKASPAAQKYIYFAY